MGQSPKGSSYNKEGHGTPLINGPVEFGRGPFGKTVQTKFTTQPTKLCLAGDLILCVRGSTTGKMNIAGSDSCIGRGVAAIRASESQEYLNHYFNFKRSEIYNLGSGSTFPNVSGSVLKAIEVPIPPLAEQEEIVEVLDKAFAAIDQAKANIEQNIANAKELFQSKLNQIFSQKGDGWVEKTLGELCVVERGSSPRPIKRYITTDEDGVNWIKIGDIGKQEKYVNSTRQKITKEGAKRSRFVGIGDFILSNSMSFGRPYIMAIEGYIHDGWFVLRLPEEINPDYFWQLLASPYLKEQFDDLAAGAIVKNISGDLVKKAIIPVPPIEVQSKVYLETEILKEAVDQVVASYQAKLSALEELKKSILQKAFAGELT